MKSGTQEYRSLHTWICRNKEKSSICSHCKGAKRTDWANLSGEYKRDLDDYFELCRKCHKAFDRKTLCSRGHQLSGDNVKGGSRNRCRTCLNENWRRRYYEKQGREAPIEG